MYCWKVLLCYIEIYGYSVEEVRHSFKDSHSAVKSTEDGFVIERNGEKSVLHKKASNYNKNRRFIGSQAVPTRIRFAASRYRDVGL